LVVAGNALRDARTRPWAAPRTWRPPGRSEGALLEVRDLAVMDAVDGVSFEIARGEAVALVGESGAGKTLTALAILGLVESTGTRAFAGRRIGYVAQQPGLDPTVRVGALVGEAVRHHGGSVEQLFERVQLPETAARRFPHELSGGM